MEEEKLIEIEGWLTLDSDNAVYYHESEPYIKRTTVEDFNPERPGKEVRTAWYSSKNFHCLGYASNLGIEINPTKPLPITLKILPR